MVCFVAQYCYLTAIRSHPKLVSIFNENRKIIKISKRKSTGSLLRRFSILLFDNIVIIKMCVSEKEIWNEIFFVDKMLNWVIPRETNEMYVLNLKRIMFSGTLSLSVSDRNTYKVTFFWCLEVNVIFINPFIPLAISSTFHFLFSTVQPHSSWIKTVITAKIKKTDCKCMKINFYKYSKLKNTHTHTKYIWSLLWC